MGLPLKVSQSYVRLAVFLGHLQFATAVLLLLFTRQHADLMIAAAQALVGSVKKMTKTMFILLLVGSGPFQLYW